MLNGMHITYEGQAAWLRPTTFNGGDSAAGAVDSFGYAADLMREFDETGTTDQPPPRSKETLLAIGHASSSDPAFDESLRIKERRIKGRGGGGARRYELQSFAMQQAEEHSRLSSKDGRFETELGKNDSAARRRALEKKLEDENNRMMSRRQKREALAAVRKKYLEAGPTQANQFDFARTEKQKDKISLASEQQAGARDLAGRGLRFIIYNVIVAASSTLHYTLLLSEALPKERGNNTDPFQTEFQRYGPWMFLVYMLQLVGACCAIIGVSVQYVQYLQHLRRCCGLRLNSEQELQGGAKYIKLHAQRFTIVCMYIAFSFQLFSLWAHVALLFGSYTQELAHLAARVTSGEEGYRIFMLLLHFAMPLLIIAILYEGKVLTHKVFPLMFGRAFAIRAILQTQTMMLFSNAAILIGCFWFLVANKQNWISFLADVPRHNVNTLMYRYLITLIQGFAMLVLVVANVFVIFTHSSYDEKNESCKKSIEEIMWTMRAAVYKGNHAIIVHCVNRPRLNGRRVLIDADLPECNVNIDNMALVPVRLADGEQLATPVILEECQLAPDCPVEELPRKMEQAQLRVLSVKETVHTLKGRLEILVKFSNTFMFFLTALSISLLLLNTVDRTFLNEALFMYVMHAIVPVCSGGRTSINSECFNDADTVAGFKVQVATDASRMDLQHRTCATWSQCIVNSRADEAPGPFCGGCQILSSELSVAGYQAVSNPAFINQDNPWAAVTLYSCIGGGAGLIIGLIWAGCFRLRGCGYSAFIFICICVFGLVGLGFAPVATAFEPPATLYDASGQPVEVDGANSAICSATDLVNGPTGLDGISNICLLEMGKAEVVRLDFIWGTIMTFGLSLNTLFLMFDMESTQEYITLEAQGPNAWATQLAQLYVFLSCVVYVPFRVFILFSLFNLDSWFPSFNLINLYAETTEMAARAQQASDLWYGPTFFAWFDQRAPLMTMTQITMTIDYLAWQGIVQNTFLFVVCFVGWYMMHRAPRDSAGRKDADSLDNLRGVRVVVIFGYICTAFPDGALIFDRLWAVDITYNLLGMVLLMKIVIGLFFLKACLQSDVLPLWKVAPSSSLWGALFYLFVLLIPYTALMLLFISWSAVTYGQRTVVNMAAVAMDDAIRTLQNDYGVPYDGDPAQLARFNISYALDDDDYLTFYPWISSMWMMGFFVCLVYAFVASVGLAARGWSRFNLSYGYVDQIMLPSLHMWLDDWCPCCRPFIDKDDFVSERAVQAEAHRQGDLEEQKKKVDEAKARLRVDNASDRAKSRRHEFGYGL